VSQTKVHTLDWHKRQFSHSSYKTKAAVHKEAQRRRNIEVAQRKAEKDAEAQVKKDEKKSKKRVRYNRRYQPKYKTMWERRYMVRVEKTHRWCGGLFFQCHGTGEVDGFRHARCRGNGILPIRGDRRSRQRVGHVSMVGRK
jgi:hypothetical protein